MASSHQSPRKPKVHGEYLLRRRMDNEQVETHRYQLWIDQLQSVEFITQTACTHSSPILSLKLWNESLLISSMTFIMASARSTRLFRCWCRVSFPSNCSRETHMQHSDSDVCTRRETYVWIQQSHFRET